ncbi:MAG: HAD-IIIA family hydrolase [Gammaproteobacteria bacterium]|nr:HAD-IIIA family hydrolase [Gammaproteobacteria bacterium]
MKPAVFFDRDGTLIKAVHYLNDPDQVTLMNGVGQVLTELEQAGYLRIIVTNQAAIGKGLLTVDGLHRVQQRLDDLLAIEDATIDGWYFCPEVRVAADDETIDFPDRKPGPGMLLQAAGDFDISLADSWMVGDRLSDALAGKNAGCRGSIVITPRPFDKELLSHPSVDFVVASLDHINEIILRSGRPI